MCNLLIDTQKLDTAKLATDAGERALVATPQLCHQIGVIPFGVLPLAPLDQLGEIPFLQQLAVAEDRYELVLFGRNRVARHGLERPIYRAECEPSLLRNLHRGAGRRLVNVTPLAVDADGARLLAKVHGVPVVMLEQPTAHAEYGVLT